MSCTFRFFPSEYGNDISQCPDIYSRAINLNDPEHYADQVDKFFEPLKKLGHAPVHVSTYLKECSNGCKSILYPHTVEDIMRSIKPKAREDDYNVVFVWDVKDITMLPINYLLELSMLRPDINATSLYTLQKQILDSVLNLEGLKNIKRKVDNIEDVFTGESNRKRIAAPMYSALRDLYNSVQLNDDKERESIIPHDLFEKLGILDHKGELCQVAEKHQEVYHQRWKIVKKCMELVNTRSAESNIKNYANVVLSQKGVASAASQLLISGLSSEVPIENIYSTYRLRRDPKYMDRLKSVAERIRQRFGENCLFVHVALELSSVEPLHYWPIAASEALDILYNLQRDTLLK